MLAPKSGGNSAWEFLTQKAVDDIVLPCLGTLPKRIKRVHSCMGAGSEPVRNRFGTGLDRLGAMRDSGSLLGLY